MSTSSERPLVSIGLPVYNAERYLSQAIDSLLGQDYPNLEVIVSDNGSDDGTERMCRTYAQQDPRLRYHRSERNMGAIWNFNRVFELARGEYFAWAAHDDIRDPRHVSLCLAALRSAPDAVLCCTGIRFIDEEGREIEVPAYLAGVRPTGKTASMRLRQVARAEHWYDFYGLVRTAALRQTRLAVPTWGFDVVVLLELCLRGEVVQVAEPLFSYRRFRDKTQQALAGGLAAAESKGGIPVCWSCLAIEMLRAIWLAPIGLVPRVLMTVQFLVDFCILNRSVAAAIRSDLTLNTQTALRDRALGRSAVLLLIGGLIYPLHNRLTRALYRHLPAKLMLGRTGSS